MLDSLSSQLDWNSFSVWTDGQTDIQTDRHSNNRDRQIDTQTIQTDVQTLRQYKQTKRQTNSIFFTLRQRESHTINKDRQNRQTDGQTLRQYKQTNRQINGIFFTLRYCIVSCWTVCLLSLTGILSWDLLRPIIEYRSCEGLIK
jgi:hypothetical protein